MLHVSCRQIPAPVHMPGKMLMMTCLCLLLHDQPAGHLCHLHCLCKQGLDLALLKMMTCPLFKPQMKTQSGMPVLVVYDASSPLVSAHTFSMVPICKCSIVCCTCASYLGLIVWVQRRECTAPDMQEDQGAACSIAACAHGARLHTCGRCSYGHAAI